MRSRALRFGIVNDCLRVSGARELRRFHRWRPFIAFPNPLFTALAYGAQRPRETGALAMVLALVGLGVGRLA